MGITIAVTGQSAAAPPMRVIWRLKQRINKTLQGAKPDLSVSDVQRSSIPGVYKKFQGRGLPFTRMLMALKFIVGDFYRINGAEVVNVSDET